jgi:hypothetical protein
MCGNVTLLGRLETGETSAFPERARVLLERMVRVSQMRGAQSGGAALQIARERQPHHSVEKCLNPKRGDLAARLGRAMTRAGADRAAHERAFLVQAHVRYATAGAARVEDSHPFQFLSSGDRGPRRVELGLPGLEPVMRPIETALTHNGDMDALCLRGVRLPYPSLRCFLERVLATTTSWDGDSPTLAGAMELFLTQGMWHESMRLAYQLVAAPPPPVLAFDELPTEPVARLGALRAAFAKHPAPSREVLDFWADVAEGAWNATQAAPLIAGARMRKIAAARLASRLREHDFPELPRECLAELAETAVDAFLDNDLYAAVRKLEPLLEGTFGCVVTSSLEPNVFVALTRGQPLSLGFGVKGDLVAAVSERTALKIAGPNGEPAFSERLDLELGGGEIAWVKLEANGPPRCVVYGVREQRERERTELELAGRIVSLLDNPYVTPAPAEVADRTAADLRDIAPLLGRIRRSFQDSTSCNLVTARAFAEALFRRQHPRLLVIGITNDLWLGEQFVQNLVGLFPRIRAEAKSANSILKDIDQLSLDDDTVVLVVSQSGQDFPSVGSLLLVKHELESRQSDAVFVLSSELDTLMGQFVGQCFAKGAPFCARIFSNLSGFRPSEAATLSVNATHLTLLEILLFLASCALSADHLPARPHGITLTRRELDVLRRRRDATVDRHAPAITTELGASEASVIARTLRSHAERWTRHVLEGLVAFLIALVVLEINLQFRGGLEPSRVIALVPSSGGAGWLSASLHVLGTQANVAFYAFLGPLVVWLLRSLQSRSALHRQGVRELLIGDTGYVHRLVWFLARKLFSLSYGFASIKPYSADSQDELVLTHEPVRGTLGLFGIPDGRRRHLTLRAQAATMTARQFAGSRSLGGTGAEILTIGHGPSSPVQGSEAHLALPSGQPESSSALLDMFVEDMFDSWDRLLAMQVFLNALAKGVAKFGPFQYDRSRTKDQVFAPTTASPVSAAMVYELLARKARVLAPRLVQTRPVVTRVVAASPETWQSGGTLIGMPAPPRNGTGSTLIGMPTPPRPAPPSNSDRRVA